MRLALDVVRADLHDAGAAGDGLGFERASRRTAAAAADARGNVALAASTDRFVLIVGGGKVGRSPRLYMGSGDCLERAREFRVRQWTIRRGEFVLAALER